jgi:GntR family transcriptional regulator/MocR family aminotransferase
MILPTTDSLLVAIDRSNGIPLQRQIREGLREAILDGPLRSGQRLPSWQALSGELAVARGTVKSAYDWLAGEGLVVGRGAQGTYVSGAFIGRQTGTPRQNSLPDKDETTPYRWGALPVPFQLGVPALDQFPRIVWARLASRAARNLSHATMAYPDPAGWPRLREAIAGYVASSRPRSS